MIMAKSLKSIVVLCGFAVRCNTKLKTDGQDNWHNGFCYFFDLQSGLTFIGEHYM